MGDSKDDLGKWRLARDGMLLGWRNNTIFECLGNCYSGGKRIKMGLKLSLVKEQRLIMSYFCGCRVYFISNMVWIQLWRGFVSVLFHSVSLSEYYLYPAKVVYTQLVALHPVYCLISTGMAVL